MKYSKTSLAVFCISAIVFCFPSLAEESIRSNGSAGNQPKYIFYFIGDGMASTQIHAAEAYQASIAETESDQEGIQIQSLEMTRFPVSGMQMSYARDRFITGSAAAATALACGIKANINAISVHPDSMTPCRTVAEMAKSKGMKVGIVTSVSLDHATPAAFYAHVPNRMQYREIGQKLIGSGFDYFAGGGFMAMPDIEETTFEAGYVYVNTRKGFDNLKSGEGGVIAVNPWLDRNRAIPYALNRQAGGSSGDEYKDSISLAEFTQKGIQLLDNEKGFFMMVEGGKIDWACHANDARAAIGDVLALDQAVKVAVDFAESHPSETLIVVTGDHETGGMSLGFSSTAYNLYFEKLKGQVLAFDEFDSNIFSSYKSSHDPAPTDIDSDMWSIIQEYFGMDGAFLTPEKTDDLSKLEIEMLEDAFDKAIHGISIHTSEEDRLLYDIYNPLSVTLTHILNQKSGIGWTTFAHTAVPIPVFAIGTESEQFNGYYENTEVARRMATVMGFSVD